MGKLKNYDHMIGNNWNKKYKTSEERQELAAKYMEHCKQGLSDYSFEECDVNTLRSYIKNHPEDFTTVGHARRIRRKFWETMGVSGITGRIKGFNSSSYNFVTQNLFRDYSLKKDITTNGESINQPISINIVKPDELDEVED